MHFRRILTACLGLGSLAVGAPTPIEQNTTESGRRLNNTKGTEKRTLPLGPGLPILNGKAVDQLARLAELEFAGLIDSQIALATQLETIKNNIRVNSFRSQFAQAQVNCIILTVTNVIDQRDPSNLSNRYLLNQLRIDNGFPDKEVMVMITDAQTMTISTTTTTPTVIDSATSTSTTVEILPSLEPEPTTSVDPSLDPTPPSSTTILTSSSSPTPSPSSPTALPTTTTTSSDEPTTTPSSDPPLTSSLNLPLGPSPSSSLLRRTLILNQPSPILLPIGVFPPSTPLVLQDPANIIFPDTLGGAGLFVESLTTFANDCRLFADVNGFLIGGQFPLYESVDEALLELERKLGLTDRNRFPGGFETVVVGGGDSTATEVPSATEELGVPTATEELEVPTVTEELGVPTATEELEVPTVTEELEIPIETGGAEFDDGQGDLTEGVSTATVIASGSITTTTTTVTVVVTETAIVTTAAPDSG
ncbi:hypothetical protein QBC38DRAFT_496251 [Podospora fimiseda]|uniref:Uncharacterized protein n=1 Tax=Podospora fimiseda TaxID=252190 RepID=A0AAN7BWQ4_9PEZI|nr:hypothetical protein QBC38DRAFT_496251 [Podospora fimiseda]